MTYNLPGKGVFVFCDAASANSICAILDSLIASGKAAGRDFLAFTNGNGVIPAGFDKVVRRQQEDIESILLRYQPDFVFTGATTLNDFEHRWRKEASGKGIKTLAFIDHWNFYKERFVHNSELFYPDEIWVINEQAYADSVAAGLPEEKLRISSNPYYDTVRNYKPLVSRAAYLQKHGIDEQKKIILYVSDNIKDVFDNNDDTVSTLGFDEFSILRSILQSLKQLHDNGVSLDDYQFVIKLHPRCVAGKFDDMLSDPAFSFIRPVIIGKEDPLMVSYYSDIVLGMFSNMVLEAMLMGKAVIRVQIGQRVPDMFKFTEITAPLVLEQKNLVTALEHCLN